MSNIRYQNQWLIIRKDLTFELCLLALAVPQYQSSPKGAHNEQNFVLDQGKPYVYVEFKQVGPRKQLRTDERPTGIWLLLKNNCRLPIIVATLGSGSESGVYTLVNKVVQDPPPLDAPAVADFSQTKPESSEERPAGAYDSEVRTAIEIQPGGVLTFSIPANQVGPTWHVEIPFRFDLKGWKGRQPSSAVAFYMSDIPKASRLSEPRPD